MDRRESESVRKKVTVSLAASSKDTLSLIIVEEGTLNHARYISKLVPVVIKSSDKSIAAHSTFETGLNNTSRTSFEATMVSLQFLNFYRVGSLVNPSFEY